MVRVAASAMSLCAIVALFMTQLPSCTGYCPGPECVNSLSIEGSIDIATTDIAHLQIDACRNDACSGGVLNATVGEPSSDLVRIDLDGSGDISCSATAGPDGLWRLRVDFGLNDAEPYNDGDIVTLQVLDLTRDALLVSMEETVDFDEVGGGCGSVERLGLASNCRNATLSLP